MTHTLAISEGWIVKLPNPIHLFEPLRSIPILGTSVTEYGVALGIENFNDIKEGDIIEASIMKEIER